MMEGRGAKPSGLNSADFVIFMGGVDINPKIYGEVAHPRTQRPDDERDRAEYAIYKSTPKQFHIGICRGAQLLHVFNGGCLWQDVGGHTRTHPLDYQSEKGIHRTYNVSSTHHQMMRMPVKDGQVWGTANETRERTMVTGATFLMGDKHWSDLEIVYYPKSSSLCFQPHPEHIREKETREVFYRCIIRMMET